MEINFKQLNEIIKNFKAHPFKIYPVFTPHTGYLREFKVKEGEKVLGPSGQWLEKSGTPLFILEREKNLKVITAKIDGIVKNLRSELLQKFVEAEEVVLEIQHPLSQEEIISEILLSTLYIIKAPETARYLLSPLLSQKIEKLGLGKVRVKKGDELLIMSFMKREVPIYLEEEGNFIVYKIYFSPFEIVPAEKPLIGLCLEKDLPYLEKLIKHIREEWS